MSHPESPVPLIDTCRVIVMNARGEILLARRGPDQSHAGEWHIPGGLKDEGELHCSAGEREIEEELGLVVAAEFLFKYISSSGKYMVHCFFAFIGDETPELCSPENDACGFFREDEIPEAGYSDNFVVGLFFDFLRRGLVRVSKRS